jgi:hypothetical protein
MEEWEGFPSTLLESMKELNLLGALFMLRRFLPLFLTLLLLANGAKAADDAQSFLAFMVEAYGGEAALRKVATVRQTGQLLAQRGGTVPGKIERLMQMPDRLKIVIDHPGDLAEKRVLVDSNSWRDGKETTLPQHASMVLQTARLRLPLLFYDRKAEVKDMGIIEGEGGAKARGLSLILSEGVGLYLFADPKTGRILQSTNIIDLDGQTFEFGTVYADYRKVDGLLFAFKEEHVAMGRYTGTTTLEKVEINPVIAPDAFKP